MFNDLATPATLLATRRSGKPRDMITPGPDAGQLRRILSAAIRVPDHGKLAPWRFVVVPAAGRAAFAALLRDAYVADKPDAGRLELAAVDQFALQAPTLVVALSRPAPDSHIPVWEQELSAGAACMNLIVATHAEGFVAGWLTGWAAYSDRVRAALTDDPHARIAGFIFIGTPSRMSDERPRPDFDAVVTTWEAAQQA